MATYHWERFWIPSDGHADLSDGGYLRDPADPRLAYWSPIPLAFEAIGRARSLVLLGGMGMGKTHTLKHAYHQLAGQLSPQNATHWIDLGAYQTDARLSQALLTHPKVLRWREGAHNLHLFLDSFDECLFDIPNLARVLAAELPSLPADRLFLRIVCRTSEYPSSLTGALQALWPDDDEAVQLYDLAPLRRADVITAARAEGVDPDAFLAEVDRIGVVPFAIRPVTLRFLLTTYKQGHHLPTDQRDLYRQGCVHLCREARDRREAGHAGNLASEQRFAIAARIAALTTFCNAYAIDPNLDDGVVTEACLSVEALRGGDEFVGDDPVAVTEDAVDEALATGLFGTRGPELLSWAHHSYGEYLAALWNHHKTS